MKAPTIGRYFVTLNVINDFGYFGFLPLQFFILRDTLTLLFPYWRAASSSSLIIVILASPMLWQIIAEAPTGVLADLFGRTRAITLSFCCRIFAIAMLVMCFILSSRQDTSPLGSGSILLILVSSQILMAIGEAALEGSIEAWLRDEITILKNGSDDLVLNYLGYSSIAQNIAVLVSMSSLIYLWFFLKENNLYLTLVPILFCGAGAVIAYRLSSKEQFTRWVPDRKGPVKGGIRQSFIASKSKFLESISIFNRPDFKAVRFVAIILALPFGCWVLLSWMFFGFGAPKRTGDDDPFILWLGIALGIARVIGAWLGNSVSGKKESHIMQGIFKKGIFINTLSLCLLAVFLIVNHSKTPEFTSHSLWFLLLLLTIAMLAKGSEETGKLVKNKFFASEIPDEESDSRATILSLISTVQNLTGFITILIACLISPLVALKSPEEMPGAVIVFAICAFIALIGCFVYPLIRKKT